MSALLWPHCRATPLVPPPWKRVTEEERQLAWEFACHGHRSGRITERWRELITRRVGQVPVSSSCHSSPIPIYSRSKITHAVTFLAEAYGWWLHDTSRSFHEGCVVFSVCSKLLMRPPITSTVANAGAWNFNFLSLQCSDNNMLTICP